jgi:hypothetical protein
MPDVHIVIDSGIGVQIIDDLDIYCDFITDCTMIDGKFKPVTKDIALNDGLSFADFKAWFQDYDLSKPMAIIHFTDFRY